MTMSSAHRPPPPPPPPGGSGGYYSSNAGATTSDAARQRLGLSNKSRPSAPRSGSSSTAYMGGVGGHASSAPAATSTAATTSMAGGGTSSDDWYGSSPAPAPSTTSTVAPRPPSSGSGFYSMNSTGSANDSNSFYGGYGGASNSYGGASSTGAVLGGGSTFYSSGSGYGNYNAPIGGGYGGSSSHDALSGGIGTSIPPASAFGSHSTSSSTGAMSGAMGGSMSGSLGGPIGGPIGGAAGAAATPMTSAPKVFDPNAAMAKKVEKVSNANAMGPAPNAEEDYENEPPLLEELGVNFPHIYSKSYAVLFPFGKHAKSLEASVVEDTDLAGPLAFALGLGGELLLSGKLHFGYVYGFGVSGCLAMTLLLNLLNPNGAVSIWMVVSILGYALLPVNLLAGVNAFVRVAKLKWIGMVMAVLAIGWCTMASTRLFERGCGMRDQRFLVAYPVALLYSAFVMITIF